MKAIITGGAGFIGSALARHAISRLQWTVLVFDKLTYAGHLSSLAPVAESPHFAFMQGDVCDRAALDTAFERCDPDIVFHLAAESHVDRSIDGAGAFVETNVVGAFHVLEAARAFWEKLPSKRREAFRLVHVSTDEVYGSLPPTGAFSETTPYDPRSPYAASKAASDHLASAWRHTYGLPVVITNCSNNFGPYQLPEKLIPLAVLNAVEGCAIPVYGDGTHVRDWLFVNDHVEALCVVARRGQPGRTYAIGGRNERTNLEVVSAICDLLDGIAPGPTRHREKIQFVPDRPGHDRRYAIDATRMETELSWRAKETFETGLLKTVRWYVENEMWWRPMRSSGVGTKRLGLQHTDGAR